MDRDSTVTGFDTKIQTFFVLYLKIVAAKSLLLSIDTDNAQQGDEHPDVYNCIFRHIKYVNIDL